MIHINGVDIDFDITSPRDMMRYNQAGIKMTEAADAVAAPSVDSSDPAYLDEYIAMLNGLLNLYGNFIDDVFGDGVAEKLLTDNPSLTKLIDVDDALGEALEGQGKSFGARMTTRFSKYTPNRATKRANKQQ